MTKVKRDPNASEIRSFALTVLAGLLVFGCLLWIADWYRFRTPGPLFHWSGSSLQWLAVILWIVGPTAAGLALASDGAGRVIYVVWMTGGVYLGVVVTFLLLTVLYFVLLPAFAWIRFKDPLRLKLLPAGQSYWEDHEHHESTLERTKRPF